MTEPSVARRIERADASVLTMAKGFGKYKPETEKKVRKVEVVEDETLKQLKEAWKAFGCDDRMGWDSEHFYPKILEVIKKLKYSAQDIENFNIALAEFQDEQHFGPKAGLFLSALINNGKGTDYVIHTRHLEALVQSIGYRNRKNITVEGNAGGLGYQMEGGTITLDGDASGDVGCMMKQGNIVVNGNADEIIGRYMGGGTITVKGNAGNNIALDMDGGEIHFEGKIGRICRINHGKIYHKGVLIVNK